MADLITLSRQSIETLSSVADLRRRLLSIEGKLANSLRQEDQSGPRLVRIARTTTNAEFPEYPQPCANTFVVELGGPAYDPTPGDQTLAFSPYDSAVSSSGREYRVAHDPTGKWWPEDSVVWVQLHHGQWFIVQPPVELVRCLLTGSLARCGTAAARILIFVDDAWCDTFCDIDVVDSLGVVCFDCGSLGESRVAPAGSACWVKWMDDSGKYEVVSVGEACCDTSSSESSSSSSSASNSESTSSSSSESSSESTSSSSSESSSESTSSSDSASSSESTSASDSASSSESTSASDSSSESESTSTSVPPPTSSSESESTSVSQSDTSTSDNCLEVVVNAVWDPVTCEMTLYKKTICGDFTIRD